MAPIPGAQSMIASVLKSLGINPDDIMNSVAQVQAIAVECAASLKAIRAELEVIKQQQQQILEAQNGAGAGPNKSTKRRNIEHALGDPDNSGARTPDGLPAGR